MKATKKPAQDKVNIVIGMLSFIIIFQLLTFSFQLGQKSVVSTDQYSASVTTALSQGSTTTVPGSDLVVVDSVAANNLYKKYTSSNPLAQNAVWKGININQAQLRAMNNLNTLNANQPASFRIYNGKNSSGQAVGMVARVDASGHDVVNNILVTSSFDPCPTVCDISSPIVSATSSSTATGKSSKLIGGDITMIDSITANNYFKKYMNSNPSAQNAVLEAININQSELRALNNLNTLSSTPSAGFRIYNGKDNSGQMVGMVARVDASGHDDVSNILLTTPISPCPTVCDSTSPIRSK